MLEILGQYNREAVQLADDEVLLVWLDFTGFTRVQVYKYNEKINIALLHTDSSVILSF